MSKHLKPHIKLKYMIMCENKISLKKIAEILIKNNLSNNKQIYETALMIKKWINQYQQKGYFGLLSNSGRSNKKPKSKSKKLEDCDKDTLICIIEELLDLVYEKPKKERSKKAKQIKQTLRINLSLVLRIIKVPRSTYYYHIKRNTNTTSKTLDNIDKMIVNKVSTFSGTPYFCLFFLI